MCNVVYKILSEIFVNRVRPLLRKIFSDTQGAFVLGRQAADQIVMAREVMNQMAREMMFGNFVTKVK